MSEAQNPYRSPETVPDRRLRKIPRWLKFSAIGVTAAAILVGVVIGGLHWIANQVRESETQWRREVILDQRYPPDVRDEIVKGWLDPVEIESLKREAERLKSKNPISD